MKHLVQMITEGDIDRCERKYREFVNMCRSYDPNLNMKEVWVKRTTKNNWAVYVGLKKLFITSFSSLDDDVIKKKNIKIVTESVDIDESKEQYYVEFMQYDPDTLEEYENGDASETDLHDSLMGTDYEYEYFDANSSNNAIHKAESIIKKFVNKHPDVHAGRLYDSYGDIVKDIFI